MHELLDMMSSCWSLDEPARRLAAELDLVEGIEPYRAGRLIAQFRWRVCIVAEAAHAADQRAALDRGPADDHPLARALLSRLAGYENAELIDLRSLAEEYQRAGRPSEAAIFSRIVDVLDGDAPLAVDLAFRQRGRPPRPGGAEIVEAIAVEFFEQTGEIPPTTDAKIGIRRWCHPIIRAACFDAGYPEPTENLRRTVLEKLEDKLNRLPERDPSENG